MDEHASGGQAANAREGVTRRMVLTGVGAAVAGGLAVGAATGVGVASATTAGNDGAIATGPPGTTVIGFLCRIMQAGLDFNGIGYLTQVAGVAAEQLFSDPVQRNEAHALLVATATGTLVARSVDVEVHSLDIEGELVVHQLTEPGASSDDAASFAGGVELARYSLDLQDVLTVIAPQTGLPVLNGTAAQVAVGQLGGQDFGRSGQVLRFTATGFGTRQDTDPDLVNAQAQLSIAGSMIAV